MALALALVGCGGAVNTASTDLRTLARSSAPNDALACPNLTCAAKADVESPLFSLGSEELGAIVRSIISAQARTEFVGEDPDIGQLIFVQRSRIFGFVDTIWIQTVDLEPKASVIMYSRSNVGFWDLGVNRRRVQTWLSEIESAVEPAGNQAAGKPQPAKSKTR